jgi:glycosyltransferase involved in cell wall biosynthesis
VTEAPTVSVLVTTYNHANFVRECLDSLLSQTFRDFEVIITDDASSDGTADRIAAWLSEHALPARFLRNETNRGLCANRNTALALARGRFICSLSGDDAYEPERLERQVACLTREPPDVALIYSDMRRVDAGGRALGASYLETELGDEPPPEGDVFVRLMQGCFMPSPAAMVRKSAFDSVGPYDESLFYEDFDMWLRLSHRYRFRYLADRLVRYRVLADSMSRSLSLRPKVLESTARILLSWEGRSAVAESNRLWHLGRIQLLLGRDQTARATLARAARATPGSWRHMLVCALHLPGVCAIARHVARVRHLARHTARPPLPGRLI